MTWPSQVRQFQNEFMKSSFVKISALTTQGRNPDNFLFVFWEKRWPHEFILKLSVNFKRTLLSHHFDQKTNTFFLRISALASVKSSNQKSINLRYITVGRLDDDTQFLAKFYSNYFLLLFIYIIFLYLQLKKNKI